MAKTLIYGKKFSRIGSNIGVPNGIRTRVTAVKGRFNALSVAGCFSIILYFQGFYDGLFCSVFLDFVFLLEQNWSKKILENLEKTISFIF